MWRGNLIVPVLYVVFAVSTAVEVLLTPTPPSECVRKFLDQCPLTPEQAQGATLRQLALLPLALFYVGLSGTARVWYVRRFRGETLSGAEVWRLSWRFFWRFVRLGLLLVVFALPFAIPYFVLAVRGQGLASGVVLAIGTIAVDVLFTFVTPGVALYNSSVIASFKGGLKVLRTTWPQCAAYALVPPLGLTLAGQLLSSGGSRHPVLSALASLTGPPLTLLFAGASTAFLIRRHPPREPYGTVDNMPTPRWDGVVR